MGLLHWALFRGDSFFSRTFYLLCRLTHMGVFARIFILNIWVEEYSSDGDSAFYSVKLGYTRWNRLTCAMD